VSYTPGPWTIDHQRIGPHGEPVALLCDVNDPMTGTVIDWPRGNDSGTAMSIDDAENEANARLIAAAPALLAALRRLMDWEGFCAPGGHQAVDEAAQTAREIWSDALAAIASATGQADQAAYPIEDMYEDMYTDEEDAR